MLVIPAIDLIGGRCVRLYQGDYDRKTTYPTQPAAQALRFQWAGFKRLHVVDLDGARSGRGENRGVIRQIVETLEIPVQFGGGIRSQKDVEELIAAGVRYLIVGSVALEDPRRVESWLEQWGTERFIIGLDVKAGGLRSQGWKQAAGVTLEEMAARIRQWRIRQVIATDIERDGTLARPGYGTYEQLQRLLPDQVSLIAAGGISQIEHITRLKRLGLRGAVLGRALYEGKTPLEQFARAG